METVFEREKHIYKSDAFEELIKDTIRFVAAFARTRLYEKSPALWRVRLRD